MYCTWESIVMDDGPWTMDDTPLNFSYYMTSQKTSSLLWKEQFYIKSKSRWNMGQIEVSFWTVQVNIRTVQNTNSTKSGENFWQYKMTFFTKIMHVKVNMTCTLRRYESLEQYEKWANYRDITGWYWNYSGNRKDLKCVVCRLSSVVRGLCQLIPMCSTSRSHFTLHYHIVKLTQISTLLYFLHYYVNM